MLPSIRYRYLFQRHKMTVIIVVLSIVAGSIYGGGPAEASHVDTFETFRHYKNQTVIVGPKERTDLGTFSKRGNWAEGRGGLNKSSGNQYWYTRSSSAEARWFFWDDFHGVFRASFYIPDRDATRPPTASPQFAIYQRTDDGRWELKRRLTTNIRKKNGAYKTGWWGWNGIHLDTGGPVMVVTKKRYSDNTYWLTADSFSLKWQDLLPVDKEAAIALCKARTLVEVVEQQSIISKFKLGYELNKLVLGISVGYLAGQIITTLPKAIAGVFTSARLASGIKNGAQLAFHAKKIGEAIRYIQHTIPTGLTIAESGLDFAELIIAYTDDLVAKGVLRKYDYLYRRYKGFCDHANGTVVDQDTGRVDLVFGRGIGKGCKLKHIPVDVRWTCVPGYLEFMTKWHTS